MNSFSACGDFCGLLITFENILDPDQARQHVESDLDKQFDTLNGVPIVICEFIFFKLHRTRSMQNYSTCKDFRQIFS